MQILGNGRDVVSESYAQGQLHLYRLQSGAYQFGVGPTATLVNDLGQVQPFPANVKAGVEKWLRDGGYEKALQEKANLDLSESAKEMPGSIEALAMKVGGSDLLASIHQLLKQASTGKTPAPADPSILQPMAGQVEVIVEDGDELPPSADAFVPEPMPAPTATPSHELQDIQAGIMGIVQSIQEMNARLVAVEQRPAPVKRTRTRKPVSATQEKPEKG